MKPANLKRPKKRHERPVFNSIRKPVAPPGHSFGQAKPEEKARPAQRKAKHKHRPGFVIEEGQDI